MTGVWLPEEMAGPMTHRPGFFVAEGGENLFDNVVPSNYSDSSSIVCWSSLSPVAGSVAVPVPAFLSGENHRRTINKYGGLRGAACRAEQGPGSLGCDAE